MATHVGTICGFAENQHDLATEHACVSPRRIAALTLEKASQCVRGPTTLRPPPGEKHSHVDRPGICLVEKKRPRKTGAPDI